MDFSVLDECNLIAFDLETTGINPFSDVPVSFGLVGQASPTSIKLGGYVNPQRNIPEAASRIHGITNEMVADAPPYTEVVPALINQISNVWRRGDAIVGMNVSYDLTMINAIDEELGFGGFASRGDIGPVIDVMPIDRHFDKFRKGKRTLSDLCAHYGVPLDNAHGALDDAAASLNLFIAQIQRFESIATFTLDELGVKVGEWYTEWKTSLDVYFQKKGEPPMESGQFLWPIQGRPSSAFQRFDE